jgi:hypothetical protein
MGIVLIGDSIGVGDFRSRAGRVELQHDDRRFFSFSGTDDV